MSENLDKILRDAEKNMQEAKKIISSKLKDMHKQDTFTIGIYSSLQALYEQNKAIIELLKNYRK